MGFGESAAADGKDTGAVSPLRLTPSLRARSSTPIGSSHGIEKTRGSGHRVTENKENMSPLSSAFDEGRGKNATPTTPISIPQLTATPVRSSIKKRREQTSGTDGGSKLVETLSNTPVVHTRRNRFRQKHEQVSFQILFFNNKQTQALSHKALYSNTRRNTPLNYCNQTHTKFTNFRI